MRKLQGNRWRIEYVRLSSLTNLPMPCVRAFAARLGEFGQAGKCCDHGQKAAARQTFVLLRNVTAGAKSGFAMALTRFDTRKRLVMEERNLLDVQQAMQDIGP